MATAEHTLGITCVMCRVVIQSDLCRVPGCGKTHGQTVGLCGNGWCAKDKKKEK